MPSIAGSAVAEWKFLPSACITMLLAKPVFANCQLTVAAAAMSLNKLLIDSKCLFS